MKNIFKLSAIAFLSMPIAANAFPVFIPGAMGVSGGVVRLSSDGNSDGNYDGTSGITIVVPPSDSGDIIVDKPIDVMPLLPNTTLPFPKPIFPEATPGDPGVIGGYTPDSSSDNVFKASRR